MRSTGAKLPRPDRTHSYQHRTPTNYEKVPRKCRCPVTSQKTMALLLCHLWCSPACYDDISPLLGLAGVLADCEGSERAYTDVAGHFSLCHVRWHSTRDCGSLYNITPSIMSFSLYYFILPHAVFYHQICSIIVLGSVSLAQCCPLAAGIHSVVREIVFSGGQMPHIHIHHLKATIGISSLWLLFCWSKQSLRFSVAQSSNPV